MMEQASESLVFPFTLLLGTIILFTAIILCSYEENKQYAKPNAPEDYAAPPRIDNADSIKNAEIGIPEPLPSDQGIPSPSPSPSPRSFRPAAGDTHIGLRRENNEDTFLCDPKRGLFAVIDGMGGMAAGEVASQLSRDALDAFFTEDRIAELQTAEDDAIGQALREGLNEANTSILEYARENPFHKGMGAAAVLTLLIGNRLHAANLGDCRAYLLSGSDILQISRDQTMAAFLMEHGELTPEEARHHQSRNELLSVLGDQSRLTPVIAAPRDLAPNEKILLCSDGLWDMLLDQEIADLSRSFPRLEEAVAELIDAANQPPSGESGGKDNITVILIGTEEEVDLAD